MNKKILSVAAVGALLMTTGCQTASAGDNYVGPVIGGVAGGIIGNQNSTATGGTRRVCQIETRYNEQTVTVYSHSEVTFTHDGKQYTLSFQK